MNTETKIIIEFLTSLLVKADNSKRKRTEIRATKLLPILETAQGNFKEALQIIYDKAHNSKRGRTEIRSKAILNLLSLHAKHTLGIEVVKPSLPGIEKHRNNQCGECEKLVLTPTMSPRIKANYKALVNVDEDTTRKVYSHRMFWAKHGAEGEHGLIDTVYKEEDKKEGELYVKSQVEYSITWSEKLKSHKKYKTIGRNYCLNCLQLHFTVDKWANTLCMPKLVKNQMSKIFTAHKKALRTLGYTDRVKKIPHKLLEVRISQNGQVGHNGLHGLYFWTSPQDLGMIRIYIKKAKNVKSIYNTLIHEVTHHFMRHADLTKIDTSNAHGDIFKALNKEACKELGYEFEEGANLRFVQEMKLIKKEGEDELDDISKILGY